MQERVEYANGLEDFEFSEGPNLHPVSPAHCALRRWPLELLLVEFFGYVVDFPEALDFVRDQVLLPEGWPALLVEFLVEQGGRNLGQDLLVYHLTFSLLH